MRFIQWHHAAEEQVFALTILYKSRASAETFLYPATIAA